MPSCRKENGFCVSAYGDFSHWRVLSLPQGPKRGDLSSVTGTELTGCREVLEMSGPQHLQFLDKQTLHVSFQVVVGSVSLGIFLKCTLHRTVISWISIPHQVQQSLHPLEASTALQSVFKRTRQIVERWPWAEEQKEQVLDDLQNRVETGSWTYQRLESLTHDWIISE